MLLLICLPVPGVGPVSDCGSGALTGQGLHPAETGLWRLSRPTDPGSWTRYPPLPRLPQQQPGAEDGRVTREPGEQ